MPLVDLSDPTLYDGGANSLYTSYKTGALTGLDRASFLDGFYADGRGLLAAMLTVGLAVGHRIVFVGAQYGWIAEFFVMQGYGPIADGTDAGKICNVETSTYFWDAARKAQNATTTIINADVNAASGRRIVKQEFGAPNARIDWCVTCASLPMLADNEIAPFCSSLRQLADHTVHWVTPLMQGPPSQDPRLNWKTLQAWKALVTPDYVVQEGASIIL